MLHSPLCARHSSLPTLNFPLHPILTLQPKIPTLTPHSLLSILNCPLRSRLYTRQSSILTSYYKFSTPHSLLVSIHSPQSILLSSPLARASPLWSLLNAQRSSFLTSHSELSTPQCALDTPHSELSTLVSTLRSSLSPLHSGLHSLILSLDAPHSPVSTLRCPLSTLHSHLFITISSILMSNQWITQATLHRP